MLGELLEWPNSRDWKSSVPFIGDRGFESHTLRHDIINNLNKLEDSLYEQRLGNCGIPS